jgi:cytochrome c553
MEDYILRVAMTIALASASVAAAADQLSGRDIAANCASCHGTDGRSRGKMPSLAGRDKTEIVLYVSEFRDGKRPSTVMQQLAKCYTDAQIEAAATYFAAQKAN